MISAQDFVDSLNMAEMHKMGYRLIEEDGARFWGWPVYDSGNRQHDDHTRGNGKSRPYHEAISIQSARLGRHTYSDKYPADQATREKIKAK